MILLASDYVGHRVVERLLAVGTKPSHIVLDGRDRGGFDTRIRETCQQYGFEGTILEASALSDEATLDTLAATKPDIGVLAWWPRIIKGHLLTLPARGWLNFHPSLLPYGRGKNPNFWTLVDETPFGVTLHFIDAGVDTGPIVVQREIPVSWEDTGGSLYLQAREAIVDLFEESIDAILDGRLSGIPQDLDDGTAHRSADLDPASVIDLDVPIPPRRLFNTIRGRMYPPHPTACFYENGRRYDVEILIRESREERDERTSDTSRTSENAGNDSGLRPAYPR